MSIELSHAEYAEIDHEGRIPYDRMAQGWHWCNDWDDMLVGPGMGELVGCSCEISVLKDEKVKQGLLLDAHNEESLL